MLHSLAIIILLREEPGRCVPLASTSRIKV
jgi:hypothetical protein